MVNLKLPSFLPKTDVQFKRCIDFADKVPCPNDMQFKRYSKMYSTPCGTLLNTYHDVRIFEIVEWFKI